jgi:hypothetical protein
LIITCQIIFNFFKKIIDNLYDINFQSNDKFCIIRIYYMLFTHLYTIKDFLDYFILDDASIVILEIHNIVLP